MKKSEIHLVKSQLKEIQQNHTTYGLVYRKGQILYMNGQSILLTQSNSHFEFSVDDEFDDYFVSLEMNGNVESKCSCKTDSWCQHKIASLMQLLEFFNESEEKPPIAGKKYTRKGMLKRVLEERKEKALANNYKIEFAENIFGEHILTNEKGKKYKLTFRDIGEKTGYCSCPDYRTNKLGTCKHLIFAFENLKNLHWKIPAKLPEYPFVEIYLDPLQDYRISRFYPGQPEHEIEMLLHRYFGDKNFIADNNIEGFLGFIREAGRHKKIKIRSEVLEKTEKAFNLSTLKILKKNTSLDFSQIKGKLFPYQQEGVEFAVFCQGAIIADEMGLGKTIQAIAIAIFKKQVFGFTRTLIICPASIKEQWKREIERFSSEKAIIIEGKPEERQSAYSAPGAYFLIANYESVMRDKNFITKHSPDFIILDEAQRIKNYNTLTSFAIKSIPKKHSLVITGTPIENRLVDLFSIVNFIDPEYLTPLWEFSYQHCYFDQKSKNKITGYYNLQNLKKRMEKILIRREKREVIKQLPQLSQLDIPVEMHLEQALHHGSFARGIASILAKKFITPFDMQKVMLLLAKMRMVCDSTYLVDNETNISPKLSELKHILFEKLDIKNNKRKILNFSEWKKMINIIAKTLRNNDIGFVELTGSVPVKKRGDLISEFEENENCRIFLSTEAGGTGLNLQVADTVINFELPWNPAKKNQRIGRIDRIGQRSDNLTVINLITTNSIETKIAAGLVLKQNLADGVLSPGSEIEYVDFSEKGRSQFLKQLQGIIEELRQVEPEEKFDEEPETEKPVQTILDFYEETEDLPSEPAGEQETEKPSARPDEKQIQKIKEVSKTADDLEQVMNQGLGFISGLFKMATGKNIQMENQKIEVNKETGEVTMKFKLPV